VVPTADRQKATVQVRIAFEALDPRLLPDMGVKVTFLREAETKDAPVAAQATTLVPKVAVQTESGQTVVYVISGDSAARRPVRVGGTDGDRLEVLAGLHAGDRVILSPTKDIKDGTKIIVK